MQYRHKLLTAALLSASILAGPVSAETLRWAKAADATTLDPHSQNLGTNHNFLHHIYETLVEREVDGTLVPRLATEWAIKEGEPNVWVFKLREGVTFHDGAPFTADDVVFSIDRARSETSNMRQLHAGVDHVVAVDDHTVEVHMVGPNPLYPDNLTNTFIMDREWSEANNVVEVQDYAAGETTMPCATPTAPAPIR